MIDIPSACHASRNGAEIKWIAIHTTEGIMDARDLGAYFKPLSRQASSHAGCDSGKTLSYVDDYLSAWTLRKGNARSINIEICGFAKWTREEWLGPQYGRLVQAANWVKSKCEKFNIPKQHIGVAGVKANAKGIITHDDYTKATGDGTHWDPGPGFPMDVLIQLINKSDLNKKGKEDEMALVTQSYGPTYDNVNKVRQHTFVVPTSPGSIYGQSWITVKSAWGSLDEVYIQCVDSAGNSLYDNTFKNIGQNQSGAWKQAPFGTNQFNVQVKANAQYSICIEAKPN